MAPIHTGAGGTTAPAPAPARSSPAAGTVSGTAWSAATWGLLVLLCAAEFLDSLDLSMVGVALPSIGTHLRLGASSLQWIVSAYILGYGSLLLLGGRAADLLGRRRVFLTAIALFGAASVVSALLSSGLALVALRFVKGASAAFTVPAGLSIITTTFAEGPARNRAFSIYAGCGGSGFSLGLVVGGLLTEAGWRVTFLVPGPIALAVALAGWKAIPHVATARVRLRDFDLLGALSSTAALFVLVYTLVEAPSRGWAAPITLGSLALCLLLCTAFVVVERRHPRPLVRLGILRSRALVHANVAAAAVFGGYAAFQFVVTLYVQDSLGWSPLGTALAFLPSGLVVALSSARMEAVLDRVETPWLVFCGLCSFVAAYTLFLRTEPSMPYAEFMLPTMLLIGAGFGLCVPAVNAQATKGVADHEQGLASGVLTTSGQVGGALAVAAAGAILGGSGPSGVHHGLLPGMTAAIAVPVGISLLALALTVGRLVPRRTAVC